MNLLKKAAVSLAATSMILAPVAATAAESFAGSRAVSNVDDESELAGTSLLIVILATIGIIAAVVVASDGGNDNPTSP